MTHAHSGLLRKLAQKFRAALRSKVAAKRQGLSDKGLLVFAHTGEVIRAESLLRSAGFPVEVKGAAALVAHGLRHGGGFSADQPNSCDKRSQTGRPCARADAQRP